MTKSSTTRRFRSALSALFALGLIALVLPACNTIEGLSDDVKAVGRNTVDTTNHVFSDDPARD